MKLNLKLKKANATATRAKPDKPVKASEKLNKFVNEKFVPFAGKVGNQTHLASIRDGFAMITPLIIAGAFALLINNVIFGNSKISIGYWIGTWGHYGIGYDASGNIIYNQTGTDITDSLKQIGVYIWDGSYQILSILIAFLLGYLLGTRRKAASPVTVGITTLAVFSLVAGLTRLYLASKGFSPLFLLPFYLVNCLFSLPGLKRFGLTCRSKYPLQCRRLSNKCFPLFSQC